MIYGSKKNLFFDLFCSMIYGIKKYIFLLSMIYGSKRTVFL